MCLLSVTIWRTVRQESTRLTARAAAFFRAVGKVQDFGVSEDFFDVEDEHTEVDVIVQRMIYGAN